MLTRLLIRFRLHMLILAVAASAIVILSALIHPRALSIPLGKQGPTFSLMMLPDRVQLLWWSIYRPFGLGKVNGGDGWTWWGFYFRSGRVKSLTFPMWTLAVPPMTGALAGHWLTLRRRKAGSCKQCQYPLKGAVICPECGRPAPSN